MDEDKKDKFVSYFSLGLAVFVMFGVLFAGYFLLFGDGGGITGFAVVENQSNPLSLKLSVNDYSLGHPFEGRLVVGAGSFSEDSALLFFVDYNQVFGVLLKDLFDSQGVSYVVKGGELVSSTDLVVDLSGLDIRTNFDYGIYTLKVKFSDGSFEDSEKFDIIS
jgi:hypothetical protein